MTQDEKRWYYAKEGKPHGPFTEHELCKRYEAGEFGPSEFVFCKGEMESWVKAKTVPGLCDSLELDVEPEPEHHAVPFYEKAAFDHAQDKDRMKMQRKERDKSYWSKLKGQ